MSLSSAAQSSSSDETKLRQILQDQEAAWNRGDGVAFAAAFSDDADFVNIRGAIFHSREAIAQQHVRILEGPYKGSHNKITVRLFTEIAPGVAVIETEHELTGYKVLPPGVVPTADGVLKTRMKYVAVKQGEGWHFVAAQNTAILPSAAMPPK